MSLSALDQLLALGIPKPKAQFALREFDGHAEIAADWCFTDGADWTPQSLLSTTFGAPSSPAHRLNRSPSPPPSSSSSSRSASHSRSGGGGIHRPPGWTPVAHRSLTPGTRVSITLKQDQGSDRTVEGIVAERLTRGDHPNGVKVRLADGRVGRVVRLL
ncbi:hypothetical protein JCM1840_003797 [Sporobolomyces johnsonii]